MIICCISQDTKKSNKIIFDAPETVSFEASKPKPTLSKKSKPLFDDNDDGDEDYSKDFRVKEQYQGEKGAELLKLQSRFKNDKRFDMDSKFWDENLGGGDEMQTVPDGDADEEDQDDERQWQYGILESVMGKRIHSEPENKNP